MQIQTIKSKDLAALSYSASSDGEAMIIDPCSDAAIYKRLADENSTEIRYIFETYRNEDYVTGRLELQSLIPSAEICHSNATPFQYGNHIIDESAGV